MGLQRYGRAEPSNCTSAAAWTTAAGSCRRSSARRDVKTPAVFVGTSYACSVTIVFQVGGGVWNIKRSNELRARPVKYLSVEHRAQAVVPLQALSIIRPAPGGSCTVSGDTLSSSQSPMSK